MGALIVLLIVIGRQARVAAAHPSKNESQQAEDPVQQTPMASEWQMLLEKSKEFETLRQEASQQLDDKQKLLGDLENRSRRLENELLKLQAKIRNSSPSSTNRRSPTSASRERARPAEKSGFPR